MIFVHGSLSEGRNGPTGSAHFAEHDGANCRPPFLYRIREELPSLGRDRQECPQNATCLCEVVAKKSCSSSGKDYSYRRAIVGSTRMARRAGM